MFVQQTRGRGPLKIENINRLSRHSCLRSLLRKDNKDYQQYSLRDNILKSVVQKERAYVPIE
jgi:hypothetical protein